jgi:hypothetical protein
MPRKALRFAGRVTVLLAVVFGPLATLILVAVLFGLSDQVAQGWLLLSMIWVMCSLVLTPAILFPESGHPPGPPGGDGGGDGGGGHDPPEPPTKPSPPRGGLPLPDAEQSRERVRDHDRPARRRVRSRRPVREPERRPVPAPADE